MDADVQLKEFLEKNKLSPVCDHRKAAAVEFEWSGMRFAFE